MSPTSSSSVASSDEDEDDEEEEQEQGWSVPPLGGEVEKRARDEYDQEPDATSVQARRARKHGRLTLNDDVEADTALAVGLPAYEVSEAELPYLSIHSVPDDYVVIRNFLLAKWRVDPYRHLLPQDAMGSIQRRHYPLVQAAHRFLEHHGYINFGVAPALRYVSPDGTTAPEASTSNRSLPSVLIIGAGLAGLAAARQLRAAGHKVSIVEGRHRPGGRVYTQKLQGGDLQAVADLGGSIITGIDGNPLAVLAKQLRIPMHVIRTECPLYLPNGAQVPAAADAAVERRFNQLLDDCGTWRESAASLADHIRLSSALDTFRAMRGIARSEIESQLLNWHIANLEFANAAPVSSLSLAHWDQDDPHELQGDHCFLPGGNVRLVAALAEGIPIFYGNTVKRISYRPQGVVVTVKGDTVYKADACLCTVPLGVLKEGTIEFDPPLPKRKQQAIEALGFGRLNKVALLFPYAFWAKNIDTFGRVHESPERRGEFFLFYSYRDLAGGPLLMALIAGEAAELFEAEPVAATAARLMGVLRSIFIPQGIKVPDPVQTVCTRWGQDPYARGAYSHIAVGASGADYDALAAPVKNRLFFAGEATNNRHPATMHGAFSSGIREAARIRDLVMAVASPCTHLAPSDYDVPVAATNARWERGEQAHLPFDAAPVPADRQEHRDLKPVPNNVDAVGLRRGSAAGMWPIGARGSLRRSDLPTYLPVDFRRATGLTRGAGLSRSEVTVQSLHNAFEQPDDEFGAFEVRYDPRDASPNATTLLRIALHRLPAPTAAPYASCTLPAMRICVQVTRAEAHQLRDTLGGDMARMRVLQQLVALSGPRSLDARAAELVTFVQGGTEGGFGHGRR